MIDDEMTKAVIGGTGGTLFLAWVVRAFIRLVSRDRVEGTKDRAERDFIETLREENKLLRERADAAFKDRNEAMAETASLRGEVAMLKRDLGELQRQLKIYEDRINRLGV